MQSSGGLVLAARAEKTPMTMGRRVAGGTGGKEDGLLLHALVKDLVGMQALRPRVISAKISWET
jgi:hypothetical protein